MALNFPSNPTDGQLYDAYIWNATVGAWQSVHNQAYIVNTDDGGVNKLYVGTVDPETLYTLAAGDIWIEVPV